MVYAVVAGNKSEKHWTVERRGMDFAGASDLADAIPETVPPLVVDIDGTLTDDRRAVDPRVFPVLRAWPETVVVATGKSIPYPIALCEFLGIEPTVIAENGGVVCVGHGELRIVGDREAAMAVLEDYRAEGYASGWGEAALTNRWRETEIAISLDSPREPLERIATEYGLEVVDTGYAYHVKSPDINKGTGLETLAAELSRPMDAFVAIGDSENDAAAFDRARTGIAVANADETAKSAADHVTAETFADGFLEAIRWVIENAESEA